MFNLFYYSMKNIKLFSLLFVAAAMIFAGCTKETESVEPGTEEGEGTEEGLVYKEFTVGASEVETGENEGSKSRTVLGSDGKSVLWQANDKIRVFADADGANAEGYEFTTTEGGVSATFGGMIAQADNYYALYPYDAYNSTGGLIKESADTYICANIPDVQEVPVNGGYDPKACISVAQLNMSGGSTFKLVCAILGFQFDYQANSDIKIKEIQVSFDDYSIINSSYMKICVNRDDVTPNFALYPKKNRVISIIPDGKNQSFSSNTIYYVCLPPFKDKQKITVKFINSEGESFIQTVTAQMQRGWCYTVNPFTLTDSNYNTKISTSGEFLEWYRKGNKTGKVTLTADINMNNAELTSTAFSGIFDGGGHTISNFSMKPAGPTDNNGLFSNLDGAQVMNLTLEKVTIDGGFNAGLICGESNSNSNTYISGCHILNSTISNAFYIGGIVGVCNNAIIDGCSIENITMNGKVTVGGLVGELDASSVIQASYITGSISSDFMYGGLVGKWSDSNAVLISCYSFTNLQGLEGGYISNGNNVQMYSSWYVKDNLGSYPDGTKDVSGLKNEVDMMNDYLEQANSDYRYVVNPAETTDFSNPPLILQKAQ